MKPILATSKTCGSCQVLKKQLDSMKIKVELKDMMEDPQYFLDHGIKSLPTLVIENVDDGPVFLHGEEIVNYLKTLPGNYE